MKINYSVKELWNTVSIDDFFYSVFIIFICIFKLIYKFIVGMIGLVSRLYKRIFNKIDSESSKRI